MLLLEKCLVHNHNTQIYVFKVAKYYQSEQAAHGEHSSLFNTRFHSVLFHPVASKGTFSWTLKALFQVLPHFLDTSVALNTMSTDVFTR